MSLNGVRASAMPETKKAGLYTAFEDEIVQLRACLRL